MIAAKKILIPVQAQYLAVKGLEGIIKTVTMLNSILKINIEYEEGSYDLKNILSFKYDKL